MKKLLLTIGLLFAALPCCAQTVLPINAGAVVANMQNGATYFKVSLTANVTSFTIIGQQANVNAMTVIFQQDATGGRTVTFASNITGCSVSGTANSSTVCTFQYDPASASWFSTGGGSLSLPTTLTAPGVFGNTTNTNLVVGLNSCVPSTAESSATGKTTSALAACTSVPSSGVANGFSEGLVGYAINNNACTTCSAFSGPAEAVGVYGAGYVAANNAEVWGGNFGAVDSSTNTSNRIIGVESDVQVQSTSTTAFGLWLSGQNWTQQPTESPNGFGNGAGAVVHPPSASFFFTAGYACDTGATENAFPVNDQGDCFDLMPYRTGVSQTSQAIVFHATNASGVIVSQDLWTALDSAGNSSLQTASSAQGRADSVAILGNHNFANNIASQNILTFGTCTLASGTCSYTFKNSYVAAPLCTATWNGTGTLTGIVKAVPSTTGITVTSSVGTDTAVMNFSCGPTAN